MSASEAQPTTSASRLREVEAVDERLHLVDEAVGVGREAEQLRELADDDRDRQADHVADLHLLREQVGDEAELAEPEADLDRGDEQRQHAGERDELGRVAGDRERDDRGEDQRPERRVRAEHEDPRRPEERVADEARDRRVEAVDGRQPRELGVRHALRNEDRRQNDPGDEVRAQPAAVVSSQQRDARNPALDLAAQSARSTRGVTGGSPPCAVRARGPSLRTASGSCGAAGRAARSRRSSAASGA